MLRPPDELSVCGARWRRWSCQPHLEVQKQVGAGHGPAGEEVLGHPVLLPFHLRAASPQRLHAKTACAACDGDVSHSDVWCHLLGPPRRGGEPLGPPTFQLRAALPQPPEARRPPLPATLAHPTHRCAVLIKYSKWSRRVLHTGMYAPPLGATYTASAGTYRMRMQQTSSHHVQLLSLCMSPSSMCYRWHSARPTVVQHVLMAKTMREPQLPLDTQSSRRVLLPNRAQRAPRSGTARSCGRRCG